ncbi:alpha/beta hydrolase [Dactylosporangium sp. NPDC051484]|uniref:alpha/beta hydrolase n=1 Tax=Dactylosporangium sp. NPDC051484 TaxID=3154942 RepID=UPI00344E6071
MRTLLLLPVAAALLTAFGPTQPDATAPPLPIHSGRYPDGRALEVVGDPSAARTVVLLVPGVDTTVADFDRILAVGRADSNDRGARVRPAVTLAQRGEAVTHRKSAAKAA